MKDNEGRLHTGLQFRLVCEIVLVELLGGLFRLLVVDRVRTGYIVTSALLILS
jgi:hypothetical protein